MKCKKSSSQKQLVLQHDLATIRSSFLRKVRPFNRGRHAAERMAAWAWVVCESAELLQCQHLLHRGFPRAPLPDGGAVVTPQAACASEPAARLLRLVALSEGIAADASFARQARRKCV